MKTQALEATGQQSHSHGPTYVTVFQLLPSCPVGGKVMS